MASYIIDPQTVRVRQKHAVIAGEEARHAIKVARRRVGERIWLIDGQGTAYDARVQSLGRDRVECELISAVPEWGEPRTEVTLAAALLKHDRFDTLVEKTAEIGVGAIWPVETAHSVVRGPSETKLQRWQTIAQAATKQCQRCRVPAVAAPQSLDDVLARTGEFDASRVAWMGASEPSAEIPPGARILVLIGPEGGFRDDEIDRAWAAGMHPISLGARRLRSETAAICAVTILLHCAGEI